MNIPKYDQDMQHVRDFDRILEGWHIPEQSPFTLEITGIEAVLEKLQEVAVLGSGLTVDLFDNASYDRVTQVVAKDGYIYVVTEGSDHSTISAVKIKAPKMLAKRMPSTPDISYIAILGEVSSMPSFPNAAPGDRRLINNEYPHGVLYEADGAEIGMPKERVKIYHVLAANAPVLMHAKGSLYGDNPVVRDALMSTIYAKYTIPTEPVRSTEKTDATK